MLTTVITHLKIIHSFAILYVFKILRTTISMLTKVNKFKNKYRLMLVVDQIEKNG